MPDPELRLQPFEFFSVSQGETQHSILPKEHKRCLSNQTSSPPTFTPISDREQRRFIKGAANFTNILFFNSTIFLPLEEDETAILAYPLI